MVKLLGKESLNVSLIALIIVFKSVKIVFIYLFISNLVNLLKVEPKTKTLEIKLYIVVTYRILMQISLFVTTIFLFNTDALSLLINLITI